ncbi:MAG: hypothetical protein HYT37_01080 [Candidatus Sungbacteria bacterium]|nr:hypothetical protein [Candidatus Sungbacteria bacterium]
MDISKYPLVTVQGKSKLLGETEQFRLYECRLPDEGGAGILKIAATTAENPLLDREAFLLRAMRDEAKRLEEEYALVKEDPSILLNYQITFPNLVESFIAEDQDDRRVNILSFVGVADDIGRLVPIEQIVFRDRVRIDPKTSAWIMGKLLKLLVFLHDQGIVAGGVDGENILIERDQHYIALFDFTEANIYGVGGLPANLAAKDIAKAAKQVILALGGDPATGVLPADDQLKSRDYELFLHNLAEENEHDAARAHEAFYRLVRALWPSRGFHPFTAYPL